MKSSKTSGLVMIAVGCSLPVVTYYLAQYAMKVISSEGGPPNQGAMLQAFFCLVASIVIGFLMISIGLYLVVRSPRAS